MAHMAQRATARAQERVSCLVATVATIGTRPSGQRHPLVAAAIVLPVALLLAVVFGGVDAVVTKASSVAGMLGR
ncbi:hypothetical protein [Streptomyces durbertensis]|uniref:hypothetical protein n=1 Tax=Streptomyces durbertensis TaxID=2448886 RepID=UPI003F69F2AA